MVAAGLIAFAIWKLLIAPRFWPVTQAQIAPEVRIPMMDGGRFDLASAKGKVVFLDFWATWCEPCKMSIPLIRRYEAAHPDALVISVDAGEPILTATRFAKTESMRNVGFDPDLDVTHRFGVEVFPTMVVIDAEGKQRAKWAGFNPDIEAAMGRAATAYARP